jgi:hypothetical protein
MKVSQLALVLSILAFSTLPTFAGKWDAQSATNFTIGLGLLDATLEKCTKYVIVDSSDVSAFEQLWAAYVKTDEKQNLRLTQLREDIKGDHLKRFESYTENDISKHCFLSVIMVKDSFDMMAEHYKIHLQYRK